MEGMKRGNPMLIVERDFVESNSHRGAVFSKAVESDGRTGD